MKTVSTLFALALLTPVSAIADDIGVGVPDPESTPPDTSAESAESTDTWWNDLLELFDLDTSDEE
jgi:hypothetical protein